METDKYLKIMEELTSNAHEMQEKLLEEILKRNAGTEYLKGYLHGQADKKLFKENVPISTYEDIMPYIDRIANGEPSDILLADLVLGFLRSTGTTGGKRKLIPYTAESLDKMCLQPILAEAVMGKYFDGLDKGKGMYFLFANPEVETPCGLMESSYTTTYFKSSGFENSVAKICTSPVEIILCLDTQQSMYCQLLIGLLQSDQVLRVATIFASTLVRSIKFLEDCWKELCFNIRTGRASDWITDAGCRNALSSVLTEPNPELADSIERACGGQSWQGIVKKLFPKTKYIGVLVTGSMSQYIKILDFYCGGLPLVSEYYSCSEAVCGINLKPLSKPSEVSYTFLPNMAYFEFLPVKEDNEKLTQESRETENKNEDIEPVDLVNVKLGQCYELLVTTLTGLYRYNVGDVLMATGFHNNAPQFRFIERKNVALNLEFEKTTETDLSRAVTDAEVLLEPLGFLLVGHTSYADTSSKPGHYVLFWELKIPGTSDMPKLDPKIMEQCCSTVEKSLNFQYGIQRKYGVIGPLEIRVVKYGTFDALMDFYVSRGASITQYKTPCCIKLEDAINVLDSKVVGRYFSPKTLD
ncbi:PREDICTED: indole-3-acetic acid-amido synthetase GH3.17 [Theobroma cacao]|uniref:Indole-3-acetic acid-amido synthetase GH3.17 n=1 Tax=Theobroma cacao TaxID=3641 RepID=A0AB32WNL8_THECC|nr:PREDICTED: indole-3-acetic acid-amido synthetase GH3.17 [Theobroma cacao]